MLLHTRDALLRLQLCDQIRVDGSLVERSRTERNRAAINMDELTQRCMDSPAFALELLGQLETTGPERVGEITTSLQSGDLERVAMSAHSLKGSSAIVAAERLRDISTEIEHAARGGDPRPLALLVDRLHSEMEQCLMAIAVLRVQHRAEST